MTNLLRKYLILLLSFLISWTTVAGQNQNPPNLVLYDLQPFHMSFSLGANYNGFFAYAISGYSIKSISQPELNLNAILDFRLSRNVNLRVMPGFRLGQSKLTMSGAIPASESTLTIESNALELPVDFKFKFRRAGNHRGYLVAGVNPQIDLSGYYSLGIWGRPVRIIQPLDFCIESGAGLDFFRANNKLAIELKFSIGILDVYSLSTKDPHFQLPDLVIDRLLSRKVTMRFQIG